MNEEFYEADGSLTPQDRSRQVLSRLGAVVEPYTIKCGYPDWDEVVERYGERFRGARLVHLAGSSEFDDSNYTSFGDQWMIVAADVENPSRALAECFMDDCRADKSVLRSYDKPTFSDYARRGDRGLMFSRGLVVAYFSEFEELLGRSLVDSLADEEWGELEEMGYVRY
jgi:hypothetical protein